MHLISFPGFVTNPRSSPLSRESVKYVYYTDVEEHLYLMNKICCINCVYLFVFCIFSFFLNISRYSSKTAAILNILLVCLPYRKFTKMCIADDTKPNRTHRCLTYLQWVIPISHLELFEVFIV